MSKNTTKPKSQSAAFAGIDFHKKFSVITLGDKDGNQILQQKVPSDAAAISQFFAGYQGLVCAIENCRGNEWMVELLRSLKFEVRVANTHGVRLIAESRCKNDKIDSRILMELLSRNYLPVVYQPTEEERLLREKMRFRTKLMQTEVKFKNIAHALMAKENKDQKIAYTRQRAKVQTEGDLHPDRQERVNRALTLVDYLEKQMKTEDSELTKRFGKDPDVIRLRTIPGIGEFSALVLIAELGDLSRFKRAKNVASYFGLVPSLRSSADVHRTGRITKQGSAFVRRILVQAAWMAVEHSAVIRRRYNRILKRSGKYKAATAIARLLAEVAFHILRDKTTFNEDLLTLG